MQRHEKMFSWVEPQSGTMAVVKLLLPIPVDQFAQELVEKAGILVMPGSVFELPGNFFRIAFGKRNMPFVLEQFEKFSADAEMHS